MSAPEPTGAGNLERVADARLPTPFAEFRLRVYLDGAQREHLALSLGTLDGDAPIVRVHSECLTGDALFSLRCDCGFQLEHALQRIAAEQRGALLYLRQEGRGIGLANKVRAYALQDGGADTVEANAHLGFAPDVRSYEGAVAMLADLGIGSVRLITNNPAKITALQAAGIEVVERVPIECGRNAHNEAYLTTKADKLGHLLQFPANRDTP